MPGGLPKQSSREQSEVSRRVDRNDRRGRRYDHADGDGRLMGKVELPPLETTTVHHGLNRTPRGVQIVNETKRVATNGERHVFPYHAVSPNDDVRQLIEVCDSERTLKSAYVVPGLTLGVQATTWVSLSIGHANTSGGAFTTFDSINNATAGDNVAFTLGSKRDFTIASTDAVPAGSALYLLVTQNGVTPNDVYGSLVYEWDSAAPGEVFELCDSAGLPVGRTKDELQLFNASRSTAFVELWVY